MCVYVCVCARARACLRACVRACACVCVCARARALVCAGVCVYHHECAKEVSGGDFDKRTFTPIDDNIERSRSHCVR